METIVYMITFTIIFWGFCNIIYPFLFLLIGNEYKTRKDFLLDIVVPFRSLFRTLYSITLIIRETFNDLK